MRSNNYIDRCLIEEYGSKDLRNGYTLYVEDIPQHEIMNFLEVAMEEDTSIRDFVLYEMQKMINSRIGQAEANDRTERKYTTYEGIYA